MDVGDRVIFINANNVAILATIVAYGEGDMEGRIHVSYRVAGYEYTCWPTLDRVGKIGETINLVK